jgi:predicted nucleic acid-binding protein
MRQVFIDTSGFYAELDGSDPDHARARETFALVLRQKAKLVTTNYVVHESWAVIQARLGWDAVDAWLDRLVKLCDVIWVSPDLHALGEARCRQARQRRLSLTDCVSIEVMRRRGIREAIAFDEHFDREGFRLPAEDSLQSGEIDGSAQPRPP